MILTGYVRRVDQNCASAVFLSEREELAPRWRTRGEGGSGGLTQGCESQSSENLELHSAAMRCLDARVFEVNMEC